MAIDIGTAVAYLNLDLTAFNSAIETAAGAIEGLTAVVRGEVDSIGDIFLGVGGLAENLGNSLTQSLTVPLVSFGQSAIDAYRSYETAFTGVKKTLSVTDDAMQYYGNNMENVYEAIDEAIQRVATSSASSAEDVAAVMEAAGQLGVQFGKNGEGLVEFTEVMIKLGDTTNLSAEEAATALAKFMNVTGTAMTDVDRLGAVIVDLGNNFATDENQIVRMSTRLASAGSIAGLTERDILALSTAMSSVGINAEAGGSSMSQTLAQIEKNVQKFAAGVEDETGAVEMFMTTIADVSGMTAQEFTNAWMNDPMTALTNFLIGMGQLEDKGESAVLVLDDLGMTGIRQSNMLKALGLAGGVLADAIDTANVAWDENIALSNEAEMRYGTLDSQISQLNEEWKAMKRDIAELLLPILRDLMDMLRDLIGWWNGLSDETKESIVRFAEIAVVVGPILMIFGKLVSAVGLIVKAFEGIVSVGPSLTQFFNFIKGVISNLGPIITNIGGAIKAAITAIGTFLTKAISVIGSVMKVFGPVASVIGGAIAAFLGFMDMMENGCNVLNELLFGLGLALAAVGAVLLGAPGLVAGVIAVIIFALGNLIANWDAVVDAVKKGWEAVKEFASNMSELLVAFVGSVVESVKNFFSGIFDLFGNFTSWMIESLVQFFDDVFNGEGTFLENLVNGVVNFIANIIENVGAFIGNLGNMIADFGQVIIHNIGEFFKNILYNLADFFENNFGAFGKFVADMLRGLGDFIGNMFDFVANFFHDVIGGISDFIHNVSSTVGDWFKNVFSAVSEWLGGLFDKIGEWFSNIWNKMVEFVGKYGDKITSFFSDTFGSLIDWLGNMFSNIGEFLSNVWSGLRDFFGNIFMSIGDAASWIWDKVTGLFGDLISGFFDFVARVFQNLGMFAENVFHWLTGNLGDLWNRISGWFSDLFGWFADLPGKFFDIGARIFSGLWDGLKSIWDKLTGWITDGISWLAGKIDKILPGFSSGKMFSNLFGSHAAGLDYVPFDGYMAQLHEGERVLTKQEAKQYNQGEMGGSRGDTFNFYNTKPDPYEYARQMKRAKREMAFG